MAGGATPAAAQPASARDTFPRGRCENVLSESGKWTTFLSGPLSLSGADVSLARPAVLDTVVSSLSPTVSPLSSLSPVVSPLPRRAADELEGKEETAVRCTGVPRP